MTRAVLLELEFQQLTSRFVRELYVTFLALLLFSLSVALALPATLDTPHAQPFFMMLVVLVAAGLLYVILRIFSILLCWATRQELKKELKYYQRWS